MNTNYEKLSKKAIGCMMVNEVIVGVVCTFLTGVAKVLLEDVELPVFTELVVGDRSCDMGDLHCITFCSLSEIPLSFHRRRN